ncbi:sugar ABC transporter ATP-binding protein [Nocardioides zeae]|uniref:ABC-type sugar transport system ATPase subunit n=1 Tax=Nocardioides zeae TaxID=1457234 RepID=A0AAJ1U3K3_9ACTN|nr:sugar ABC transporter ATP-binding protein [Nocardioides zeae]MDQ1103607.1 ABC-type sugar transport system ATPase subunit [Nocardioides zeae]
MSGPFALEVAGVAKAYPGVQALRDVSLAVRPGEVRALLGENGAGKSTLIKIVTGAERPDTGTVTVGGTSLHPFTPRSARRLGVRVVHQERQVAGDLSVAHNVLLDNLPGALVTQRGIVARAREVIDRLGLDLDPRAPASSLSAADQQLVELARALSRRAALVVMDEPTASLRRDEVTTLFRVVEQLRSTGTAVLYISHHLHEVFEIADTATVLRNGERVGELVVAETTQAEIVRLMFDRDVDHVRMPRPRRADGGVALRLQGVSIPPRIREIDLDVRRGEVLALCGTADSGTSEVAELLAGVRPATTGAARRADGRRVGRRTGAAAGGIGFVPADRKAAGLLLERSIAENAVLGQLRGPAHWTSWPARVTRTARRALDRAGVRASDPRGRVSTLSGGNQQRVIIARWLLADCEVLVLDQPTAGVDVAAKFELYHQLLDLTAEGIAVVVVSSDYEEICALADRVVVMRGGAVVGEVQGADATPDRLYQLEMDLLPTPGARG